MQGSGRLRGRRGYGADFKQRVLTRLASGDASLRQVAKEFDVSVPTLIKWRRDEEKLGSEAHSVTEPVQKERGEAMTEIERLRQEVEQLKQERDRLRQGIALLAGLKVPQ